MKLASDGACLEVALGVAVVCAGAAAGRAVSNAPDKVKSNSRFMGDGSI